MLHTNTVLLLDHLPFNLLFKPNKAHFSDKTEMSDGLRMPDLIIVLDLISFKYVNQGPLGRIRSFGILHESKPTYATET